ncbi:MAG: response regulator [Pirellulales bacterium]|nr:response regulator [Pirellulales bacterium]
MKTVFTTGEAAKICKVSQQTIIRCFDSGQLKGFRVPGSRFRRIPRDQLYAFMRDNGIPTDALDSGKRKILVVDDDESLVELMVDALERDGRFEVRSVNNGFGAGMMIKEFRPDLVVLDVMLPDINGKEVCNLVRSDKTMDDVRIICISGMVEQEKILELRSAGADDFMKKPFDIDQLIGRACQLLDMEPAAIKYCSSCACRARSEGLRVVDAVALSPQLRLCALPRDRDAGREVSDEGRLTSAGNSRLLLRTARRINPAWLSAFGYRPTATWKNLVPAASRLPQAACR